MKRTNPSTTGRIALELSLKPFGMNDGRSLEECARHAISAWRSLCEIGNEVSFMLWVADGSDILEYRGKLSDAFEWGRYIGFCNHERDSYDPGHHPPDRNAIPYVENPRTMTYADLKQIVALLKSVGEELLRRPITVGATFDPGPEFAESPFKYDRHREIIVAKRQNGRPTFPMVDATSRLHADDIPYAAYPEGIPEDEPFARFLGRQIGAYCGDLGFDYVWLSNGYGFSALAWDYLGPGFDGERFHPEERGRRLVAFKRGWTDLMDGNPGVPIEVRGSNFAAGMDISTDGVDFQWLYSRGYVRLPPPNSPWGILNQDYGLEIAGYLSRAVGTNGTYLYRFYPNDPWFWQNPWTDIFYGRPYDIYVPLSTAIVSPAGEVTTPSTLNFLTGDTEFGETDPLTGLQVASHIRTALAEAPDDLGLVTWVYPFGEYHERAAAGADGMAEVFFGDWYVRSLINNGLPVATAATPNALDALLAGRSEPPETVVLAPTAAVATKAARERLSSWLNRGIPAILYGPAESLEPEARRMLGLELAAAVEGELELVDPRGASVGTIFHDPIGSGGGVRATFAGAASAGGDRAGGPRPQLVYQARPAAGSSSRPGDAVRAYCTHAPGSGRADLFWVRGTNNFETRPSKEKLALKPIPRDPRFFDAAAIGGVLLGRLGYDVLPESEAPAPTSSLTLFSRHDNAWYLSGYSSAPVGAVRLRFSYGAPVFNGTYTKLRDGASHYPLARAMRQECRVFVRQDSGIVGCDTGARNPGHAELTLTVSGLSDATIVFFPPVDHAVSFESDVGTLEFPAGPTRVEQGGVSGTLTIRF